MLRKHLIGVLAVLMLLLTGCSSQSESSIASSYREEIQMGTIKEESAIDYDMSYDMAVESAPEMADEGMVQSGGSIDTSISLNRKMIKTGYLDIETKTFDLTNQTINEKIKTLGGFTEQETIYGNREETYSNRSREMTIRIPEEHFDTFINTANDYGNVTRTSVNNEDVTDAYVDIEIRLETLMIQKDRLQVLLSQSGELKDLFEIENELADVTYEIESLKGSLNKYDSLIDYATIHLYIKETLEYKEVQEPSPTLIGKIENQFRSSMKALGDLGEGILLLLVGASPFLVILGIVGFILFKVVRRRKKASKLDVHHDKTKED